MEFRFNRFHSDPRGQLLLLVGPAPPVLSRFGVPGDVAAVAALKGW